MITVTETKTITGVTEVVTTNTQTIKESSEFKQISDFLVKNHPDVDIVTAVPIVEKTDKYQLRRLVRLEGRDVLFVTNCDTSEYQ